MRHLFAVLALLLVGPFSAGAGARAADTDAPRVITYAPLPMETPETVLTQTKPMLAYLEQRLGVEFRIDYATDYAEILRNFKAGEIDVAYLGPLPYVLLKREYSQVTPIARFLNAKGTDTYTCSIVTFADSFPQPSCLGGKKIALTQPFSTCGYLSVSSLLAQADLSLEDTRYRYTGSHTAVALGVAAGEFDGGGLKTAIGKKYAHLGLSFIAETDPLPGFVLAGNQQTLTEENIRGIRAQLTRLRPLQNTADAETTRGWGRNIKHGAVAASDRDFETVRAKLGELEIPRQGNF